jgi:DNA-binding NtrC family response regulator
MIRILVIEKKARTRALLQYRFGASAKVKWVGDVDIALEKLANHQFDLIYWSAVCAAPVQKSLADALAALSNRSRGAKMLVLTGRNGPDIAPLDSQQICLRSYPISDEELLSIIEGSCSSTSADDETRWDGDEIGSAMEFEGMITVSLGMRRVVRQIMDAAAVDIPVLITGETGTGKDLVAAAIHRQSRRRARAYVPVNLGAMAPELIASEIFGHERGAFTGAVEVRAGIFEQANGGTVFLDEIATMDDKTQVSLLRVLEEQTIRRVGGTKNIAGDVRIIAATNEDLEKSVMAKRFREDLFYRLNVFHISMPPLRERAGAVTVLTDYFMTHFAGIYAKQIDRISPETYRILRRYPWPGNIRELKNVIQTAVLLVDGKELTPEFIPPRIREATKENDELDDATLSFRVGVTLNTVEKELIRKTLIRAGGNKKLAATILGISRRALYNKIKRAEQ